MKGRICYARFWDEPGIEKLFTFIEVKSSFLKPVTSRPCGVAFLIRESVAGALVCRPDNTVQSKPVTVLFSKYFGTPHMPADFFFTIGFIVCGRFRFFGSIARVRRRAGHRLFQCLTFFTWRLCPPVGVAAASTLVGQPF